MCVLERLLQELLPKKHKILIFSQMTTTLDILQGYLTSQKINCYRLDGSTSREEREANIAAFTDPLDPDQVPVYLLSTRAGGVGINLQAADTVIFFDSDWNPQVDMQAMSRAHRLGQTETVLVLRLVTCGYPSGVLSAEQRILRTAAHKLVAEQVVLEEGQFDMGTSTVGIASGRVTPSPNPASLESDVLDEAGDGAAGAVALLDKEQGVLSLFAVDDNNNNNNLDTAAAAAVAVAPGSGKSASSFATPLLLGMEALDPAYLGSLCTRNNDKKQGLGCDGRVSPGGLPSAGATQALKAIDVEPLDSSSATAAVVQTQLLGMQTFNEAADWAPWLGMPPGFEEALREELVRLKRENRVKLEKLRAEDEEKRRKADAIKRAAEQERLDAEQAILDAKAGAVAAIAARRNEMARKKAEREAAREAASAAKAVAAAAKAAAKLAKASGKQAAGGSSASTPLQDDGNSPSRPTRVRSATRKLLDEDSLWGDAIAAAEAEAPASAVQRESGGAGSSSNSGERRPVGRLRKNPLHVGQQRSAFFHEQPAPAAASADIAQENDICVLCGESQSPAFPSTTSAFELPGDEAALSSKEREQLLLLCEGCEGAFHMNCLGLREVPQGEWQCRMCSVPVPVVQAERKRDPSALAAAPAPVVAAHAVEAQDAATAAMSPHYASPPRARQSISPCSSGVKRSLREQEAAVLRGRGRGDGKKARLEEEKEEEGGATPAMEQEEEM